MEEKSIIDRVVLYFRFLPTCIPLSFSTIKTHPTITPQYLDTGIHSPMSPVTMAYRQPVDSGYSGKVGKVGTLLMGAPSQQEKTPNFSIQKAQSRDNQGGGVLSV